MSWRNPRPGLSDCLIEAQKSVFSIGVLPISGSVVAITATARRRHKAKLSVSMRTSMIEARFPSSEWNAVILLRPASGGRAVAVGAEPLRFATIGVDGNAQVDEKPHRYMTAILQMRRDTGAIQTAALEVMLQ